MIPQPRTEPRPLLHRVGLELVVLAAYAGLAILITWPLIQQLDTHIIGYENCTNRMHVWVLWVVKQMLGTGDLSVNTDYIFYPNGSNMVRLYGSDLFYPVTLSPLVHALSPAVVYNLKIMFSFFMAPYGAYLILRHVGVWRAAAWLGGALFICMPYFLLETFNGVSELVSVEWIPFAVLFTFRTLDRGKITNAALAALFFLLSTYSSGYNAFFLMMFFVVFLVYRFVVELRGQRKWSRLRPKLLVVTSVLCGLGMLPMVALHKAASTSASVKSEHVDMVKPDLRPGSDSSAELMTFFRPGRNQIPLIRQNADGQSHKTYTTYTTYLGFAVLALAVLGVFTSRRRSSPWLVLTVFFFLVSLGPFLRIHARPMLIGDYAIPMPSLLLYYILPGFEVTVRHTYRYVTMLHLMLAILAGLGIQWILELGRQRLQKVVLFCTTAALCFSEILAFGPAPYPIPRTSREVPSVYKELAADKQSYAIIELPYEDYLEFLQPHLYWQTTHGKKLIAGAVHHRIGPPELSLIRQAPLALNFMHEATIADKLEPKKIKASIDLLAAKGFRYVLVHETMFKDKTRVPKVKAYLSKILGPPKEKPGKISLYELRAK